MQWRPATDLKLLELLLGDRVEDVGGVGRGGRALRHLEPIFKARVVVQEFTPQPPRLLDPNTHTQGAPQSQSVWCAGARSWILTALNAVRIYSDRRISPSEIDFLILL